MKHPDSRRVIGTPVRVPISRDGSALKGSGRITYSPKVVIDGGRSNYSGSRRIIQNPVHLSNQKTPLFSPEKLSTTPHRLSKTLIEIAPSNGNKLTAGIRQRNGSPGQ